MPIQGGSVRKLLNFLPFSFLALSAGHAVAAPLTPATVCHEKTEILTITPHESFDEIGRINSNPVYQVTYRHCGGVSRLLIQLPTAVLGREPSWGRPIFF